MASENQTIHWTASASRALATTAFFCGVIALTVAPAAADSTFQVIHTFRGGSDGEYPEAGLTEAPDGTMYSTTFGAIGKPTPGKHCPKGCGNEYSFQQRQLTPDYGFEGGGDGAFPSGEVVVDSSNNEIYGTTEFGGGTACNGLGCGTVFALGEGVDRRDRVFQFCPPGQFPVCANGAFPHAGPIIGRDGNLYGTTSFGGLGNGLVCDNNFGGCGTVYMLNADFLKLQKRDTVLYSFCQLQSCEDGAIPYGKVLQDASGNFYGTTQFGGMFGAGVVFKLKPDGTEKVLYSFCSEAGCADGAIPEAGLIADTDGNLYGTASAGGGGSCEGSSPGCGVVFKLTPGGTYSVLHTFLGGKTGDGALPQAPLVVDAAGNLYGTTEKGGDGKYCSVPKVGCGMVFMLAPDGTEKYLHIFGKISARTDGAQPEGALLLLDGVLYGATRVEGKSKAKCNCGTLFSISVGRSAARKTPQVPGQSINPDKDEIRSD